MRRDLDADYLRAVRPLLEHPDVLSMRGFRQHGATNTLEHCLNVSRAGYAVCRRFGWNAEAYARAALLHDLYLYDWHLPHPDNRLHAFRHPSVALRNAAARFALAPLEREIIFTHMWPVTPLCLPIHKEAWLITVMDKYCAFWETAREKARLALALVRRA